MSIVKTIPDGSRLMIVGGVFSADFNNPTIGRYNFTDSLNASSDFRNRGVSLGLELNGGSLYYADKLSFNCNVAESDFLETIDLSNDENIPKFYMRTSVDLKSVYAYSARIFKYYENFEIGQYFLNNNSKNVLLADFSARFKQNANMVGVGTMYAQLSLSIYEIVDTSFIGEWRKKNG
jgi:hypothetical protein